MFSLLEFLFGLQDDKIGSTPNTDRIKGLEEKIQILENRVASLQEKVIHLENQRNINMLSALDRMSKNEYSKTRQGDYHLIKIKIKIGLI